MAVAARRARGRRGGGAAGPGDAAGTGRWAVQVRERESDRMGSTGERDGMGSTGEREMGWAVQVREMGWAVQVRERWDGQYR